MSLYSPLENASAALDTALNVTGLVPTLCTGVFDFVPQGQAFPFVMIALQEHNASGFGTKPGTGSVWQLDGRVHIYSQAHGYAVEAHPILAKVKQLLADAPATLTGGHSWAIFWDEAMPVGEQDVAGQRALELVANFRWMVEES